MCRPMIQVVLACVALLLGACSGTKAPVGRPEIPRQTISGTFEGQTGDGEEIVVTLDQSGEVVQGVGSEGGYPLVIGGAVTWTAFATLTREDGSTSATQLSLSGDGETLTVRRRGRPDLVLERSESAPAAPAPPGPLSGTFEAHAQGVLVGVASIVQRGDLLVGMGNLLGEAAGISARLVEPDQAKGTLTFLDRSQIPFEAEFSDEGDSLVLQGLGAPIHLQRVGGSAP